MSLESLLNDAENLLMKWIDQNLPAGKGFDGAVVLVRRRINGENFWSACCEVECGIGSDYEKYELANSSSDDCKTREEALIELCENLVDFPLWELSKWPEDMVVVTSSSSGEIRSIDEVYPQHILDQKMLVVN